MEIRTGARRRHILTYFYIWFGLIVIAAVLNAINVDWYRAHPLQAIVVVVVLTMLQASAMEFLMITVVSLMYAGIGGRRTIHIPRKYDHKLTMLINFNLLARCEEDIENAYKHMYESFMSNLSPDISAVLLSVTGKENLRHYEFVMRDNYRALIRKTLVDEGEHLLRNQPQFVDPFRLRYFWKHFEDLSEDEVRENLDDIANAVAKEFMCIHRVSKVLKKCGQYQDLFLLSEGEMRAYTYTDLALYSTMARPFDEPLFFDGPDVDNIHYRQFDYCLTMDNDTVCPPGTAQELLAVAAAHPDRGIIQPSIKMSVKDTDTIYMHLEMWRQRLNEPLTRSMATLYGQWGFYGKGMINIRLYIKNMIGTRDRPLEIVPIDVLSHDTYEAAVLRPLYVDSLCLEEEPSYNYVTWHIRERRWNQGELILSRYFWPNVFGRPIGFLQKVFNKRHYIRTGIRTKVDFGLVSTHVAHSALRSMFMKPMMLVYIFLQIGVPMHRPFLPLAGVLFLVCIFPKFAITNWGNARFALLETLASILQYTPEAFVGSVRLGQAIFATVCKSCTENWTPQRVVEEDMRHSNPFTSSVRHLWAYSVVAVISTVITAVASPEANLIYFLFFTIIIIPLFTGFTSLNPNIRVIRTLDAPVDRKPTGPVEALMEEGGPRVPHQWSNLRNDPPLGTQYTPQHSDAEQRNSQTFINYETEDAPMRRPQQRTEVTSQLLSQAPSLAASEQGSSYAAPRQVLLDEASIRVDRTGSRTASRAGSDVSRPIAAVTEAATMQLTSGDLQGAGPSGQQEEKRSSLRTAAPTDQVIGPRLGPELSPRELVKDTQEEDDADDEDTDQDFKNTYIPGLISEPLPEPPPPILAQPVTAESTEQPLYTGKGKGKGKKLVLSMKTKDDSQDSPEPEIPTLEEVMGKKKPKAKKVKSESSSSKPQKWKRISTTSAKEKKTSKAPPISLKPVVTSPRTVPIAMASAPRSQPQSSSDDAADVVGGLGRWKKLPPGYKVWDSEEPWQPPTNWRQVTQLKPEPIYRRNATCSPSYGSKDPSPRSPPQQLTSPNSQSPRQASTTSIAPSPPTLLNPHPIIPVIPSSHDDPTSDRLGGLPQAWTSDAVAMPRNSSDWRTIPVQPLPKAIQVHPSAPPAVLAGVGGPEMNGAKARWMKKKKKTKVSPQVWTLEEAWNQPPNFKKFNIVRPAVKRNYPPYWSPSKGK